ncbi:MAG: hypothetical protein LBS84_08115 [Clostridiales bacterium]|nr:hypothetical protein [Clostridiales bacterium]
MANPDPAKVSLYIDDPNFYDRADLIIKLAKKLRAGNEATVDETDSALNCEPKSHYAIVLKTAIGYVQAASDYFERLITFEELEAALDIGKKGRDGKYV